MSPSAYPVPAVVTVTPVTSPLAFTTTLNCAPVPVPVELVCVTPVNVPVLLPESACAVNDAVDSVPISFTVGVTLYPSPVSIILMVSTAPPEIATVAVACSRSCPVRL